MGSKKWATIPEVAEAIKVHPNSVRNMIADGRLTGYRLGKAIRLDMNEVEAAFTPMNDTRASAPLRQDRRTGSGRTNRRKDGAHARTYR